MRNSAFIRKPTMATAIMPDENYVGLQVAVAVHDQKPKPGERNYEFSSNDGCPSRAERAAIAQRITGRPDGRTTSASNVR